MSHFRNGLLFIQRRTDTLGGAGTDREDVLRVEELPSQVVRRVLTGWVPLDEVTEATGWCDTMAREVVNMVHTTEGLEVAVAAVSVAIAQTLCIGTATERSATGRLQ